MSDLPKPGPNERRVLKQGDSGAWTVFLQDELNGCGYGPLDLDGDFGPNTLEEVIKFQKDSDLTANGTVDASTWTALENHKKLLGWQREWPSGSLELIGIGGVDTTETVTEQMIGQAHDFITAQPRFWGRYFQNRKDDTEYLHAKENKPLHDAKIRVLPISRQTDLVNRDKQQGIDIGRSHAADVLKTFGEDYLASQGDAFYIFLDVENGTPSLSVEFYQGWSEAVVKASSKVQLLPSVYLNPSDGTTLSHLSEAMKSGAKCYGLWIARYVDKPQIQHWKHIKLVPPVPCKILLHQYVQEVGKIFDFNQINPYLDDPELVLKRLILPPA